MNKILDRRNLDYENTRHQIVAYLERCAQDVRDGRALAGFLKIAETETRVVIAANGSPPANSDLGMEKWFSDLAAGLSIGQDVGKLSIEPDGNSTMITVRHAVPR